jgi:hypothetical protein
MAGYTGGVIQTLTSGILRFSLESRYEDALEARTVRPCTRSRDCACIMRLSASLKPMHCRPTHATWNKIDRGYSGKSGGMVGVKIAR